MNVQRIGAGDIDDSRPIDRIVSIIRRPPNPPHSRQSSRPRDLHVVLTAGGDEVGRAA